METYKALNAYYSSYDEDGRLQSRHGQVEFLTTMQYINRYLRPGMRILEIGAATGRYSHALARTGYEVDAVELIQHNIDIFNCNTHPARRLLYNRAMPRICICLGITPSKSPFFWDRCITCSR